LEPFLTTSLASQEIDLTTGQILQIHNTAPQIFILAPSLTNQAFVVVQQGQDLMAKFSDGSELMIKDFYANNGVLQLTSDSGEVINISAEILLTQTLNPSNNADNENKESDQLDSKIPSTNDSNLTSHHIVYSQGKPEALTQLLETWPITEGSNQLALAQQLEATEPAAGGFLLPSLLGLGGAALAAGSSGGGESVAPVTNTPALDPVPTTPTVELNTPDTGVLRDNITKDNQLIVTQLDTGATWQYSTNGGVDWSDSLASSITSFRLEDGAYDAQSIQVKQIDQAGNESAVSMISARITIDTTAPTIPNAALSLIGSNASTNDASLTGPTNKEADAELAYRLKTSAGEFSEWDTVYTAPTTQGSYVIEVRQTDTAGNVSESQVIEFTLAEFGILGLLPVDNKQDVYETILGAGQLNAPLLTGFGPENSEITLTFGDVTHVFNSNDDGYWEYLITPADITAMGIGEEIIRASYTDLNDVIVSAGFDLTVNAQATVSKNYQENDEDGIYVNTLIYEKSGWENTTITYSFNNSKTDAKSQWTDTEQEAFADALQTFSNVANVTFVEGIYTGNKNTGTNMVLHKNPEIGFDGFSAWFQYPLANTNNQVNGNFNYDKIVSTDLDRGSFNFMLYIHEVGHGLGLVHPFGDEREDDGPTQVFPGINVDDENNGAYDQDESNLNQKVWTVMAYRDGRISSPDGYPVTPMLFDIAALQLMYGANKNYETGDNIYLLPTEDQPIYSCIWDAGGIDTISNEGSQLVLTISLNH